MMTRDDERSLTLARLEHVPEPPDTPFPEPPQGGFLREPVEFAPTGGVLFDMGTVLAIATCAGAVAVVVAACFIR